MNISTMGQLITTSNGLYRKNMPSAATNEAEKLNNYTNPYREKVDMRNISLNEINALIKSGVDGLLDVRPTVSPNIIEQYGPEYAANIKIDFLSQLEGKIAFKDSIGEETELLKNVLENLKNIDGMEFPTKMDLMV